MMSVGSSCIGNSSGKVVRDFRGRHFGDWRVGDTHDTVKDTTALLVAKLG